MSQLELLKFVPFRLNRLAAEVSGEVAKVYADRFGISIVEWRIMATLAVREPCSAQLIVRCTRTHKSRVSRGANRLIDTGLVARVDHEADDEDRRESLLRLTEKGRRLYRRMVPPVLAQEASILDCLDAEERRVFTLALDKLERSLGLVQDLHTPHD